MAGQPAREGFRDNAHQTHPRGNATLAFTDDGVEEVGLLLDEYNHARRPKA